MQQVRPRMRFADLERMPEDGRRFELYDGELSEVPSPLPRHQRIALNIAKVLREYENAYGGLVFVAPLDIVLDDYNVVQPDVVFFGADRASAIDMDRPIRFPPDLAIEILSPTTKSIDRSRKLQLLARFGVREYWLIDPIARVVDVFVLERDSYVLTQSGGHAAWLDSRALPSFIVAVADLFAA